MEKGIDLKLKNKIYIILIFIIISSILLFATLFYSYNKKNTNDLQSNINNIVEINRYNIESSLKDIYKEHRSNKQLFYEIHHYTQEKFKQNRDYDLEKLKQLVLKKYNLKDIDINIFLIDKSYTITDTTFQKDLGFNLSVIEDAKKYLDKTKEDSKIYVASNISIDILDAHLNVYSYSKIDDTLYFEMGFKFNNSIYKKLQNNLKNVYEKTKNKISLYRVIDTADGKEIYNNLFIDKSTRHISKANFEKSLVKFDKNRATADNHINAIRFNTTYQEIIKDKLIVYVPLLNKNKSQALFYNNLLMKIEVDISRNLKTTNEVKWYFCVFGFILILLLAILYYFIKYNFYKPMMKISNILESEKKIEDITLLNKKDEFGILVTKYNKLYDTLNNEIQLNAKLLYENKRFIADTVHQIRTPLTNIMMNGEMVKKFQSDEKLSEFIDQIDASINMLSNSYEDLAYVTSYDAIEYLPSVLQISYLLKKRINFFTTISKVNYKKIISNIDSNLTTTINEIECERIIDNNISNAIKYATPNKAITINLYRENSLVILEFKTYGKPIKNKEKIFDKNYRENESKRGLGLGLNMVKNICDKYEINYTISYEKGQNIFIYRFKSL